MLLKFLQKILAISGKRVIKKYQPIIIGITGSVGKSSTKQAIAAVLKDQLNIRQSKGNYNNEIGVPLTIFGCSSPGKNLLGWLGVFIKIGFLLVFKKKSYPKVLVLEMAADRPGDIEYLIKIAPCQIGALTAISPAHTEFFKTMENVAKEKQAIIAHLPKSGWAVLNADDENVRALKNKTSARVLTYGLSSRADIQAREIYLDQELKDSGPDIKGLRFKIHYQGNIVPVFLPQMIGLSQVYSVLAAIAAGITFNFDLVSIASALKKYHPLPGRMVLLKGTNESLIIDDTYNSSPKSVESALKALLEIKTHPQAEKRVILGDMLELGNLSQRAHYQIGQKIGQMGFDYLLTVGEQAREIAKGARQSDFRKDRIFSFEYSLGVAKFLRKKLNRGDIVLVKGSQGIRMERIVKQIMAKPYLAKKYLVRQGRDWLRKDRILL